MAGKASDKPSSDAKEQDAKTKAHLVNEIALENRRIEEASQRKSEFEAELAKLSSNNG